MIQCKQCGATFAADARYCNYCDIELDVDTSVSVFDQHDLTKANQEQRNNVKQLKISLCAVILFIPFAIYVFNMPFAPSMSSKLAITLGIETCAITSLICLIRMTSAHTLVNILIVIITLLLLLLSPVGLIPALFLMWHLVRLQQPKQI